MDEVEWSSGIDEVEWSGEWHRRGRVVEWSSGIDAPL